MSITENDLGNIPSIEAAKYGGVLSPATPQSVTDGFLSAEFTMTPVLPGSSAVRSRKKRYGYREVTREGFLAS